MTGRAIASANPKRSARMSPAMASAAQTPDATRRNGASGERLDGATRPVKLLIVAVSLAAAQAQPQMPADLVRDVAAAGSRLVAERNNYTYTQAFKFYEVRKGARAGRYEEIRDITFTATGERIERYRKRPLKLLDRMRLTEEDFRDLRDVNPFVLNTETLWFYRVSYKGVERAGGEQCHVLRVRPRQVLAGQRFFDGLLWVSTEHGNVVLAAGRPVPQIHRIEESNLFPGFETRYEPVDGEHWFPVRTVADDVLPFPSGNQRVQVFIEYSDYQRFTATSSVTFNDQDPTREASEGGP